MGITVLLETEGRELLGTVADPKNLLHVVLPDPEDREYQWAGTIDWYGDTVFNPMQAKLLLGEWARLIDTAPSDESRKLLVHIENLLKRCANGRHIYVRFYGD